MTGHCSAVASSPGSSQLFNVTLKNWEEPGDEASSADTYFSACGFHLIKNNVRAGNSNPLIVTMHATSFLSHESYWAEVIMHRE